MKNTKYFLNVSKNTKLRTKKIPNVKFQIPNEDMYTIHKSSLSHSILYSIISSVCIKRTVWKCFHMTLLNVQYDLKIVPGKNSVSIKRTV